jgi:hypothetical protein
MAVRFSFSQEKKLMPNMVKVFNQETESVTIYMVFY